MKKETISKTKPVSKKIISKPTFDYKLTMQFNDKEHIVETNDLDSAIMELKPPVLKTRILIKVEKDGKVYETALPSFVGKQLLRNNLYRRVFLNRLILK
jgi:hypothetical protein